MNIVNNSLLFIVDPPNLAKTTTLAVQNLLCRIKRPI